MNLLAKFRRPKPEPPSRQQSLAARPTRHPQIDWRDADDGTVALRLPQSEAGTRRVVGALLAAPPSRSIALDEIGSEIWRRCDGQNSVRDLIRFMMERYQFARKEADASVTTYLRQLGKRGLVGFAMPSAENSKFEIQNSKL